MSICGVSEFMGIWVATALLVAFPLLNSAPKHLVLPFFIQLQPQFKGYGDSPRPSPISRLHVSEGASVKRLSRRVEPEYPRQAKNAGIEGDVIFRIIVGVDGRVQEIHLRRGKPLLIEAAAKALSKWQYEPYMLDGTPVEFETFATIRFRPPDKRR